METPKYFRLFKEIKNQVHDATGIKKHLYWYFKRNGVWYPSKRVTEDELQSIAKKFIADNSLPNISLDDIPIELFNTVEMMDERNTILLMFDQL